MTETEPPTDDTDRTERQLHELEQKKQAAIPNQRHQAEGDVLVERKTGGRLLVVSTDGKLIGPFSRGTEKMQHGESILKGALFPFTLITERRGRVEITQSTRFYYEAEETHIRADRIRIDSDGRLYITFQEARAAYPRRSWEFRTKDLAAYIEQEKLRSDKEVNERVREAVGLPEPGADA